MTLTTRTIILPSDLQAILVHQPQADRAAALVRIAADSHHEPLYFPGLTHLLEYLSFYDDEHYREDERLVSWVQRRAGDTNVTTLTCYSASFFEVAAEGLASGVMRPQEMLQAPLLFKDDIQREAAVIDTGNGLIQQHELSRREAVVRHVAIVSAAFRRFQIDDAGSPGEDFLTLQAALRDFHYNHYVTRRM